MLGGGWLTSHNLWLRRFETTSLGFGTEKSLRNWALEICKAWSTSGFFSAFGDAGCLFGGKKRPKNSQVSQFFLESKTK